MKLTFNAEEVKQILIKYVAAKYDMEFFDCELKNAWNVDFAVLSDDEEPKSGTTD